MRQIISMFASITLFNSSQAAFAASCPSGLDPGEVQSSSLYYAALGDKFKKCEITKTYINSVLDCGDIYIKAPYTTPWEGTKFHLRAKNGNFYPFYSGVASADGVPINENIKRFGVNPLDKSSETKYIAEKQLVMQRNVYDKSLYSHLLPNKLLQIKVIDRFIQPCESVSF